MYAVILIVDPHQIEGNLKMSDVQTHRLHQYIDMGGNSVVFRNLKSAELFFSVSIANQIVQDIFHI